MESSSTQDYRQEQPLQNLSRAPSYSPITNPSSSQKVHQQSASTEAAAIFPANLPSPSVPIRLEPHSSVLDNLTAQYDAQGSHPILPEVTHALADQISASEALSRHVTDRLPFVRAASSRLQAVIGLRNDLPFDLLMGSGESDAENLVMGAEGKLVDLGLRYTGSNNGNMIDENGSWHLANIAATRNNARTTVDVTENDQGSITNGNRNAGKSLNATRHPRITSINTPPSSSNNNKQSSIQQRESRELQQIKISSLFPPSVNQQTGEGLREYLLARALITGSKKRECRSISFHDFTPDLRTGEFRNELLEHFGIDGTSRSDRIEVVELSLPDTIGTLHPWLSIFIQRPLVSLDPPIIDCPSTRTPPNFPKPTPSAWLCVAVPIANITTYPIQADSSLPSSLLEETLIKNRYGLPTKKVAKRQDFDFSFQGIPIFEFSTRQLFGATSFSENGSVNANRDVYSPPIADFLSVDGLKPYDPKDPYLEFPAEIAQCPELIHAIAKSYAKSSGLSSAELQKFGKEMEDDQGVDISEELSPNDGTWWNAFYRGMTKDRIRWEKIRRSMGRGRCRVVIRWQDAPEELKLKNANLSRGISEEERSLEDMTRQGKFMGMQGRKRKARNGATMSTSSRQDVGLGVMNADTSTYLYSIRPSSSEVLRENLRAKTRVL